MALHRIVSVLVTALAAGLVCSAALSFSAGGTSAGSAPNGPTRSDGFGGAAAAPRPAAVHPIWTEPASRTRLTLHRVPCAEPNGLDNESSCFAATTAEPSAPSPNRE
jgi:hypothetical protein